MLSLNHHHHHHFHVTIIIFSQEQDIIILFTLKAKVMSCCTILFNNLLETSHASSILGPEITNRQATVMLFGLTCFGMTDPVLASQILTILTLAIVAPDCRNDE